jgi:hypothetical protein
VDAGDQVARPERLGDQLVRAELQAGVVLVGRVVGREHDDRDGGILAYSAQDVETSAVFEGRVEHDEVGLLFREHLKRGAAGFGARDLEPLPAEIELEQLDDVLLALGDKNLFRPV